jgi:arylsulfatase A-like enzyme
MEGFSATLVAAEAIKWLNDIHDPKKPFVLSVWFHEPHLPIATDPKFSALYAGHPNREYLGNVTQMDHGLGMIMDALEAKGLTENTLVFFTSDNGPEGKGGARGGSTGGLRGRKRSDYEGGIRVPGIARWPGHIKPGTVSDVPVVGTDIFATVLDVTGFALPKDRTIDGVSMMPAFAGRPVERKVPLFWRTHISPPGDRLAMRIGDWKIVGNDELTTFDLYDIQKDWKEENNLAGKMPEKAAEMRAALLKLWKEIEAEGPKDWWLDHAGGAKGAKGLNY